jgi:hypothetical protein
MKPNAIMKNGKHLFAALAVAIGILCSSFAPTIQAGEPDGQAAVPKAPPGYAQAMLEEMREAQQAQQLMPYLLALHVDGKTRDGRIVRINIPIKFTVNAAAFAKGLFPTSDDDAAKLRLLQSYSELEQIFGEELSRISVQFLSTAFYRPAHDLPHLCDVGSDELCTALEEPLQFALVRAQQDKPYRLAIVSEWVNFYGFFNSEALALPTDALDAQDQSMIGVEKVADHF